MNEIESTTPHLTPEGKFALVLIGCILPLFLMFMVFGKPELGITLCVCGAIVATAIRFTWTLHNHAWYWIAVAIALLLQPLFMVYVPWTDRAFRGTALLPFGVLDYLAVWGCIKIAEKTMTKAGHKECP